MERPTCRTCAYWQRDEEATNYGDCRRYPAMRSYECDLSSECAEVIITIDRASWNETQGDYDWCGEHSDFHAYLASLRTENPIPATERISIASVVDELDTRAGKRLMRAARIEKWEWVDEIHGVGLVIRGCGEGTRRNILAWRDQVLSRRTAASNSADRDATRE
jgi:hypothetical protein